MLNTDVPGSFCTLAGLINNNRRILLVLIQHEFGFFERTTNEFLLFLKAIDKPVIITFHTVLPHPNEILRSYVKAIAETVAGIVVMTHTSAEILIRDYQITNEKTAVIPHGTHLVMHADKTLLKEKYGLTGKKYFPHLDFSVKVKVLKQHFAHFLISFPNTLIFFFNYWQNTSGCIR